MHSLQYHHAQEGDYQRSTIEKNKFLQTLVAFSSGRSINNYQEDPLTHSSLGRKLGLSWEFSMPTSGKEHKDLIEGIKQDNAFFQQMVDLIPKDLTATKSVEDKDGEPMKKKKKKKKESQMTDGETKTDDVTKKKKKKKLKMKDPDIRQIRSESGTSSVDVLRQKLHTQLEELKGGVKV
ncbi:hypothetical protein ScPMuIL_009921 [Solemya velum]